MEIPVNVRKGGKKIETTSWDHIMHYVCTGSMYASDDMALALEALVALKKGTESGWAWDEAEIPQLLSECVGERPRLFEEFLKQLVGYGLLPQDAQNRGRAFHSHEEYENLWGRWQAPPDELTHDAALYCFENWSLSAFTQLWETFSWHNAQDLVVLLLRIILCHTSLKTQVVQG